MVLQREDLLAGVVLGPTQEGRKLTVILFALLEQGVLVLQLLDPALQVDDFSQRLTVLAFLILQLLCFLAERDLHLVHLSLQHGELDPQFLRFLLLVISQQSLIDSIILHAFRCWLRVDDCLLKLLIDFEAAPLFLLSTC